jgi:CTP:molybdopterin cytidylyltransferase MocA
VTVCGVVLAAGAGTRFGGPKALARTAAGEPWLALAVGTLRAAGCEPVVVVLGTGADEAEPLVPAGPSWCASPTGAVSCRHPSVSGWRRPASRVPSLRSSFPWMCRSCRHRRVVG